MDRFTRYAIPAMIGGCLLALLYIAFSAASNGSNRDPIAKYATGELDNLDTSERGIAAPSSTFTDLAGESVTLQTFEGKTILVNFWATWCGPCEREMPSLAALQTARGSDKFQVVAISIDAEEDRDYAVRRLRELGGEGVLDFYHAPPTAWDIVYDAGAKGFPTSIIYDAAGAHVAKLAGEADWASYEAIALIDTILKAQP